LLAVGMFVSELLQRSKGAEVHATEYLRKLRIDFNPESIGISPSLLRKLVVRLGEYTQHHELQFTVIDTLTSKELRTVASSIRRT